MVITLPFYRNTRAVILAARALADRDAVASVHVAPKLLTDKERKRLIEVKQMLAEDRNPFALEEMKKAGKDPRVGGSTKPKTEAVQRELSKEQVEALTEKWGKRDFSNDEDLVYFDDITLVSETPAVPAGVLLCSFCKTEVDETRATRGKGLPKFVLETHVIKNDLGETIGFEDKWRVKVKKVIACPNCCLHIKQTQFAPSEG